ncbi:hypothetical protein [Photorhabdus khanii]|uniref:Ricin B lectin domain-containing protein n=1 Tax=Photorhabdus khanii subsp. guanajuatensis TaxID=2100166 RepID=A0A4R4K1Z7_9GAMM|nr:hypothetical protein [Photorhabdus khanii]TDB61288.1 hypothetical protein C5467_04985 [Photorhabdus khanii subsp. guanajuatensis]
MTLNTNELQSRLYDCISKADYSDAQEILNSLNSEHLLIKRVITSLLDSSNPHILPFAYFLWQKGDSLSVTELFPKELVNIIDGGFKKIINQKYNAPLKLGTSTDGDGDHTAYGGVADINRLSWRFVLSEYDSNTFIIYNKAYNVPLKLGTSTDGDGDHIAYGGAADIDRCSWQLVYQNDNNTVIMLNKAYNVPLKLGTSTDGDGDHKAYGGAAELARCTWQIEPI